MLASPPTELQRICIPVVSSSVVVLVSFPTTEVGLVPISASVPFAIQNNKNGVSAAIMQAAVASLVASDKSWHELEVWEYGLTLIPPSIICSLTLNKVGGRRVGVGFIEGLEMKLGRVGRRVS